MKKKSSTSKKTGKFSKTKLFHGIYGIFLHKTFHAGYKKSLIPGYVYTLPELYCKTNTKPDITLLGEIAKKHLDRPDVSVSAARLRDSSLFRAFCSV